jgi:hypothetical protein
VVHESDHFMDIAGKSGAGMAVVDSATASIHSKVQGAALSA